MCISIEYVNLCSYINESCSSPLILTWLDRFAYGEMYMSLATILCRFDLQLFETSWRRDVSYTRECFLDESDRASPGIRVRVVADNRKFTS